LIRTSVRIKLITHANHDIAAKSI